MKPFIEREVIELFENSHPWLRETWDYITSQNVFVTFRPWAGGKVEVLCPSIAENSLWKCNAELVEIGRYDGRLNPIYFYIVHELGHVYSLANGMASKPGPLGIAHLYLDDLVFPSYENLSDLELFQSGCDPSELYADALTIVTFGDGHADDANYWSSCNLITDTVSDQALAVFRSAAAGEMPSWFADTYNDADGDPDLERLWLDVKAIRDGDDRRAAVFQLRNSFGGYCDNQKATDSVFGSGTTRNPWSDGSCVPEAPGNVTATAVGSGKLTVSWQEPTGDGGSPIEGYKVQWKSGTQEYDSGRQALVTSLTDLRHTISGLTNDESYTLRVLAYNQNGNGAAAETVETPTATDTTAPTLLAARVDGATLRLTWNETLDGSSEPATTAFTVNSGGLARTTDEVEVSGSVVTLSLESAMSASDTVTVGYSAPTGSAASPLRDPASNNVADFSAQSVRNETTQVAITSDPGPDMTYIWGNGFGGQDSIEATVTFSENVIVSGVPELALLVGGETRRATFRSGSGTSSLVFRYRLTEGETDAVGISVPAGAISTAGGLVRYASTNRVAPAQVVLGRQSGHLVDAVRPVLVSAQGLANGNELTLTWDKALDEDSVPTMSGAGFGVENTSANASRDISATSVLGRVVTLTLSSTISATDQLTVSYGVPSRTHPPLKDTLGNYAGYNTANVSITQRPNSEPEFPSSEDGARSVDENTPANRNIGAPVAADDGDNDSLTYAISGADAAFFDVVATSGQLRTKAALNYESRASYSFTMSVHDGRDIHNNPDPMVDNTISVTVTVNDVDEPADVSFTPASGVTANNNALVVDENHDGPLATFRAIDPENKPGLTYTWFTGGRDRYSFAITADGVLSFIGVPDYERPTDADRNNVYSTGADTCDSDDKFGIGPPITVTVRPVNEPPTITDNPTPSLEEEGPLLVGTYGATDPENATVAWQPLGGADSDKFEFTASNGRLAFKAAPDYEDATDAGGDNIYDVTLSVSAGGHTTTLNVAVSVTNKDEGGALSLSSPQPQADAGYTATLSDHDEVVSSTWTWERSTSRNGPWTSVAGASHRATTSVYTPTEDDVGYFLRVTAAYTDGHGPNKSRVLVSANSVKAAPAVNAPPSFDDRTPTRSIPENARARAAVGRPVTAIDTNNGDVLTYELSGSDLFTIDSNNGQIRVAADESLDHETASSHSVTVKASDPSNAIDTVTVTITVNDVNESPEATDDTATTNEDEPLTFNVLDNDWDPENDELTVRVSRGPRNGSATVDPNSYEITYTPSPDYHGADTLTYVLTDGDGLTDTGAVTLDVRSVNDPPAFPAGPVVRKVAQNAREDGRVGSPVTARDADPGDQLTYSLVSGFPFAVEAAGQIVVATGAPPFDLTVQDSYTVTIVAHDRDGARAEVDVRIEVVERLISPSVGGGGGGGFGPAPVAPSFSDGFRTTRAVAENARPGDAVGEPVSATHPDELEIAYSLSGTDSSLFTVDEETGQIRVQVGVDLTIGKTYTVNLTATDSAGFGAIIIVMIEVTEAAFSPYDRNGNDRIERDEVIMAVADYFKGSIDKDEVIEVIKLYFTESG